VLFLAQRKEFVENCRQRLFFLDNIKVFLTLLVIFHHAGQAYGPTGGFWEYKSSLGETIPALGRFFAVNAAYFMGFFFLISGYFMVMSYDKNNGSKFLRKRLIKFGIPLLFAVTIMIPLQRYFHYIKYSGNIPLSFIQYYANIWLGINGKPDGFIVSTHFPELNFGHTWYIEHLLVYSFIYWIIRAVFRKKIIKEQNKPLSTWKILVITLIVAVSTTIVMNWYPYDTWEALLGFFQVEIAHWPQYIILFIVGCIAYRKNWIFTLKAKIGYIFLSIAVIMVLIVYIGGFNQLLMDTLDIYSSILAVFIIFGIITLFREKLNKITPCLNIMARISYAAYIIHYPIILIIEYSLDKVTIGGAWGKFIVVSFLSILISYGVSFLLTRVKYINKVV
jgi:peptidoglycan/LPS O-acetylase OafA/YrhL